MKTLYVKEYDVEIPKDAAVVDLMEDEVKQCLGCWCCWLKTPGVCAFRDLDYFYQQYLSSDMVNIYCKVTTGFISSNLKAVIDRMIVMVLPYISWDKGESYHEPRYTKYPTTVNIFFKGELLEGEEEALRAYFLRTFDMMFTKNINIEEYKEPEEQK